MELRDRSISSRCSCGVSNRCSHSVSSRPSRDHHPSLVHIVPLKHPRLSSNEPGSTNFSCADEHGRRGVLWLTSTHVAFYAPGGARVAIDLRRILSIHLPLGTPLRCGLGAASLQIQLTGHPSRVETFFEFVDRTVALHELVTLLEGRADGAQPPLPVGSSDSRAIQSASTSPGRVAGVTISTTSLSGGWQRVRAIFLPWRAASWHAPPSCHSSPHTHF